MITIKPITIENGQVSIRLITNGVWLTQSQITDLFGVFTAAVNANIRAILKSGVLDENRVIRRTRCRDGNIVERYSFEMIAALAFRLKSENAEVFRRWLVERVTRLEDADKRQNVELILKEERRSTGRLSFNYYTKFRLSKRGRYAFPNIC